MATYVNTDASVTVNSVDLSDHVASVTLKLDKDAVEDTNMGDSTHINLAGLKNWTIDITFAQDFASSKVDATLWGVYDSASGTCAVIVVPTSSSVSATNPSYTGTGLLTGYDPINGSVGSRAETTVSFVPAGDMARGTGA